MDELRNILEHFSPIDTHFHYFHCLDEGANAQEELEFAFASGLRAAVDAGTVVHSFSQRKELAERYPHLYLLCGHHPDAAANPETLDMDALKEELTYPKTLALGEVGLDYSYEVPVKAQQEVFARQLEIAKAIKKPVVLHVREAHEDALAIIREHEIPLGIIHCFTGDTKIARSWLDAGFYLSFSGIVSFKKAVDVQQSAIYTPLDRLFCETDSPFLAPVPMRGKSNRVGYVAYVYQYICQLRGEDPSKFSQRLAENFSHFCPEKI